MRLRGSMVLSLAWLALGCAAGGRGNARASEADLLHAAMDELTNVMVYDILSPPQSSRVYAYASIAAYEALRPGNPEYRTLAGQLNGLDPVPAPEPGAEYSYPLAAVHAFMTVGRTLIFSRARLDSARLAIEEQIRSGGVAAPVYARSIAYGDSVAAHILGWAAKDHFLQTRGYPKYTVTAAPGRWIPTPPAYMDAVEANWAALRPFVMDSATQFRPVAPPPFDTLPGTRFHDEASEVVALSRSLTEEQRAIAAFWDCNPYVMHVQGHAMFATKKISPGGHWMSIAGLVSRKSRANLMVSAEAYARTSIALADAFISTWEEKYRSRVLRPETYINRYFDEEWVPVLQTPPFPEYPSGHSVISNAAAVVLASQFGTPFAYADSSELRYGLPVRTFPSFEAAAEEAAMSRMYGGIHFRSAVEQGMQQGRKIGALVVAKVRTGERVALRPPASASPPTLAGGH